MRRNSHEFRYHTLCIRWLGFTISSTVDILMAPLLSDQMQAERTVAELIRQPQEKLLASNIRTSIGAVADLLADEFVEFGSSGRVFNKQQIIASLQQEDGTWQRSLQDFEATLLAPGVILATYRASRQSDDGEPAVQSLRSSIWKLIGGRWQMAFHQGTPTR